MGGSRLLAFVSLDVAALPDIAMAASLVVALVFGGLPVRFAVRDRRERRTIEGARGLQTRVFAQPLVDPSIRPPAPSAEEWRALPEATGVTHLPFLPEREVVGRRVYDTTIDRAPVGRTLGSGMTASGQRFQSVILELGPPFDDPYRSAYLPWPAGWMEYWLPDRPRVPAYRPGSGSNSGRVGNDSG